MGGGLTDEMEGKDEGNGRKQTRRERPAARDQYTHFWAKLWGTLITFSKLPKQGAVCQAFPKVSPTLYGSLTGGHLFHAFSDLGRA